MLKAEIWLLNDSGEKTEPFDATVSYAVNGEKTVLASVKIGSVEPRSNKMSGMVSFEVGADFPQTFKLTLESEKHPEYNSEYELVHKLSELPKN